MPTLLRQVLPALVFTLVPLSLPSQSIAGGNIGDDTNAASVLATDSTTWAANMQQVMGGASTTLPGAAIILGPTGIYAKVQLSDVLPTAHTQAKKNCMADQISACVDKYLSWYFGNLLNNQELSGISLETRWYDLQPTDPGALISCPTCVGGVTLSNMDSLYFSYIDDAFDAIINWNTANASPSQPPMTLQLGVSAGFHSPLNDNTLTSLGVSNQGTNWLTKYLNSCDALFMNSGVMIPAPGSAPTSVPRRGPCNSSGRARDGEDQ
jgi:hypothetical protein